eukprot:TRINITY_DN1109_c0_g1_i3.p1 TRINITY_DN1109_c0_g1~~TRINITY_DN1109_c0_g1_i3.p1  ORF type:complete len:349 (+),score=61.87 TRINITY_DN1109_c0_g1_i3:27-1049(+)
MNMKVIRVFSFGSSRFDIEVRPTDSVWGLKWKIYDNKSARDCYMKKLGRLPPGPDEQRLFIPGGEDFDRCERTLESYSFSGKLPPVFCEMKRTSEMEYNLRKFLNVCRKNMVEFSKMGLKSPSWMKHSVRHMHELRSLTLIEEPSSFSQMMMTTHIVTNCIPSLKKLDILVHSGRRDEVCIHLAERMETNYSLKELNMCDCRIGWEGAAQLAKMLAKNMTLVELRITQNTDIGEEGSVRIFEGLKGNASLKLLDMKNCGVGPKAAQRLGELLEENSSLINISLEDNVSIGDEGFFHIIAGLERNTSLRLLKFNGCGISMESECRVKNLLCRNRVSRDKSR